MPTETVQAPSIGELVRVPGQQWIVGDVEPGRRNTLVSLQSVEENHYGEALDVIWEVEAGRQILPSGASPAVNPDGSDPPERLAAFLDAVRWSAVTSADVKTLQAPFRSGVFIEDYQLEPVARAVDAPRVNLLLADDVGLGKTIEAGLVALELMLRHRAQRILIVCPAGLTLKWRDEMAEKFGLDFAIINSERCAVVRRTYGSSANPFLIDTRAIVSLPWLREAKAQRLLAEVLPSEPTYPRTFDLLILDEAHHVAPSAPKQVYAVDSQQTKLIRRMVPHFTHRLFLSATPHNGYQASYTALLEILDDQRFARGATPDKRAFDDTVIRRVKADIVNADGTPRLVQRRLPDNDRDPAGPASRVGVPTTPFPTWFRCTACNELASLETGVFGFENLNVRRPHDARFKHENCRRKPGGKRPLAIPARFVLSCTAGHLDDFPWVAFIHRGDACPAAPQPSLQMDDRGGNLGANVKIQCRSCGAYRNIREATGARGERNLPRCRVTTPTCGGSTRMVAPTIPNCWSSTPPTSGSPGRWPPSPSPGQAPTPCKPKSNNTGRC